MPLSVFRTYARDWLFPLPGSSPSGPGMPCLRADSPRPPDEPGYRTVAVKQGDKTRLHPGEGPARSLRPRQGFGRQRPGAFQLQPRPARWRTRLRSRRRLHLPPAAGKTWNSLSRPSLISTRRLEKTWPCPPVPRKARRRGYSGRASGFDQGFLTAKADVGRTSMPTGTAGDADRNGGPGRP